MSDRVGHYVGSLPCGVEYYSRAYRSTQNAISAMNRSSLPARVRDARGFTMIEIMITVALMSILMVMTAGALTYYFSGKALDTSTRELTTQIREAQTLAVSTGNTYRIDFSNGDTKSYQMQYRQGGSWVNVRAAQRLPGDTEFSTSSPPSFGGDVYMDFYPRGTTESGQIVVHDRFGRSKTVSVNGETANVSVN